MREWYQKGKGFQIFRFQIEIFRLKKVNRIWIIKDVIQRESHARKAESSWAQNRSFFHEEEEKGSWVASRITQTWSRNVKRWSKSKKLWARKEEAKWEVVVTEESGKTRKYTWDGLLFTEQKDQRKNYIILRDKHQRDKETGNKEGIKMTTM